MAATRPWQGTIPRAGQQLKSMKRCHKLPSLPLLMLLILSVPLQGTLAIAESLGRWKEKGERGGGVEFGTGRNEGKDNERREKVGVLYRPERSSGRGAKKSTVELLQRRREISQRDSSPMKASSGRVLLEASSGQLLLEKPAQPRTAFASTAGAESQGTSSTPMLVSGEAPHSKTHRTASVPILVSDQPPQSKNAYASILYMGTARDYEYFVGLRVTLQTVKRAGTTGDLVALVSPGTPDSWQRAL